MRSRIPKSPAIYARISRDKLGKGLGVERQIEECKALAQRLGWPEPKVYFDNDISAKSRRKRPQFEVLLGDIASGRIDGLMAWHLDRVLRKVLDLERVVTAVESQRHVVPVVFVKAGEIDLTTASGRMLARILASVAAAESELKAERIASQRRQEAMNGAPPPVLGYGYNADNTINRDQAEIVREVAERLLGGASVHGVAVDLNKRGVPTPASGLWEARRVAAVIKRDNRPDVVRLIKSARDFKAIDAGEATVLVEKAGGHCEPDQITESSWGRIWLSGEVGMPDSEVADMLRETGVPPDPTAWRSSALVAMVTRGALCGWREYSPGKQGEGEIVAAGDWPPILSKDVVEQLRARFRQRQASRGRKHKYLLSGFLRCGACNSPMMGGPTRSGNHRYGCMHQPGKPHCGKISIAGRQVDAMVTGMILDVLADADVRAGLKRVGPSDDTIREAEDELAEVARMRQEYARDAADGLIRRDEWMTLKERLAAREKAATAVLGTWSPRLRDKLSDVPAAREDIEHWWEDVATLERKRDVVRSFIEYVPVSANRALPGSNRFDAGRVGEPVWLV